ncbi:MAG: sensor histidine kinase, partial [Microcystaceae cyanobacterium]
DLDGQLPSENQHQMQLLRDRVYRMEKLINSLLEYSRVGRLKTSTETVNVSELLTEVLDSLAPPTGFRVEIESEMPTLTTERLLLSQVLANLLSNAIKHHPRTEGYIKISVAEQGNYYQFAIADDGRGIPVEQHDRIFTIFQTLKASDKKESTGIGLAIVKKIVERQGGTITLESQLGQGTTFCFTWPK